MLSSPLRPLAWSSVTSPLATLGRNGHRIAYTHLVSDRGDHTYFGTSQRPEVFEAQVRFLAKYFDVISIAEAVRRAGAGESLKGTASISTDDGFVENHTIVAPILDSHGVTGTFFCVSQCIDNRTMMWRSQLFHMLNTVDPAAVSNAMSAVAKQFQIEHPQPTEGLMAWSSKWDQMLKHEYVAELWNRCIGHPLGQLLQDERPYLTSAQLKDLVSRGHSIGSHSVTHPICPQLSAQDFVAEVADSASELSDLSGSDVRLFAYPFGQRPKPELEAAVIEAGVVDALLGISSVMRNGNNPLSWERDNVEFGAWRSQFEFSFKPMARRLKYR